MHETHMARSIVSAASSRAESLGASHIKAVRVRLGAWTCIDPDSLANAFATASEGTVAAGAELKVELVAPSLRCEECGASSEADSKALRCIKCGSARVVLEEPADMQVQGVDV